MSLQIISNVRRLQKIKAEKAELRRGKSRAPQILWWPRPENIPQQQAYNHPADRLFYGGSAGGGKSDLLLGLAFTAHETSIIFRREYPQLKALIQRSRQIASGHGRYNGTEKTWTMDDGKSVEFGAVQHEWDVEKYQGRPHEFLGFDELPHFTRAQFEFLTGWNRSAEGNRCRIVCSGNPPTTPEGAWVKEYWGPWLDSDHELYPYPPGELLWFVTVEGKDQIVECSDPVEIEGEVYEPHSRSFIPAKLSDNPDLAKTSYRSVLMAMPEPLRSQMLYGSFDITPDDDPWQVIPTAWVDAAMRRWDGAPHTKQTALGVDVARGGKDETILAPLHNWHFGNLIIFPGSATPNGPKVAAQVMQHLGPGAAAFIDVVGVGSSVYDCCEGIEAYAVSAGTKAERFNQRYTDKSGQLEFQNLRSWMIWRFRELLDPESNVNIILPRDNKLKADLCAPRWEMKPPTAGSKAKGRICVESKDQIKKRIGRSPDRGDAVIYASLPVEHFKIPRQYAESRAVW